MKYDVFISYARKDYVKEDGTLIPNNIVSQVKNLLSQHNITYWFDEEGIYSGDEFTKIIADAIENSHIFLFISSIHSNKSEWTVNEIATAKHLGRKILPFRIDFSSYNSSVMMYIAVLDYINYKQNPQIAFEKLLLSINNYLSDKKEIKHRTTTFVSLEDTPVINIETKKVNTKKSFFFGLVNNKGCTISISIIVLFFIIAIPSFFFRKIEGVSLETEAENLEKLENAITPTPRQAIIITQIQENMVNVKGGKFIMGIAQNTHTVILSSFKISKYEVTQKEWEIIMGYNNSKVKGENFPVTNITWVESQEFIHKLCQLSEKNFALPTEAQWEYAARGGANSSHTIYSGSNNLSQVGVSRTEGKLTKIGSKKGNELGLYDMSGNVWEWCQDGFIESFDPQLAQNPIELENKSQKVMRGGAWNMEENYCTVYYRGQAPLSHKGNIGLRLVINE